MAVRTAFGITKIGIILLMMMNIMTTIMMKGKMITIKLV